LADVEKCIKSGHKLVEKIRKSKLQNLLTISVEQSELNGLTLYERPDVEVLKQVDKF
jgi:hypothetical protein